MPNDVEAVVESVQSLFTVDQCPDPEAARLFGPGNDAATFRHIGMVSFRNLVELADLRPSDRVLDIGCGPGRVALPLSHYLTDEGNYVGLDPVSSAVEWCTENITSRRPNFTFTEVDWHNSMYNRDGGVDPVTYRFPFPDDSFDVIYLFSVFTHMTPRAVTNYLSEIGRLLAPGGRLLATMFLADPDTQARIAAGTTHRPFALGADSDGTQFWTDNKSIPESAVAFRTDDVSAMLAQANLTVPDGFVAGGWRVRAPGQDILVARPGTEPTALVRRANG